MNQAPLSVPVGWRDYVLSYGEYLEQNGKSSAEIIKELQELKALIISTKEYEMTVWASIVEIYRQRRANQQAPNMPPRQIEPIVQNRISLEPTNSNNEPNVLNVKKEPLNLKVQNDLEPTDLSKGKKENIETKQMEEMIQRKPFLNPQQLQMQPQQQSSKLRKLLKVQPRPNFLQQQQLTPAQQVIVRVQMQKQQQLQKQNHRVQVEQLNQEVGLEQGCPGQMVQPQQFGYQKVPSPDYFPQFSKFSQTNLLNYSTQSLNFPSTSANGQLQLPHPRARMPSPPLDKNFVEQSTSSYHQNRQY